MYLDPGHAVFQVELTQGVDGINISAQEPPYPHMAYILRTIQNFYSNINLSVS